MKGAARKTLMLIMTVTLCVSTILVLGQHIDYLQAQQSYVQAQDAVRDNPTEAPPMEKEPVKLPSEPEAPLLEEPEVPLTEVPDVPAEPGEPEQNPLEEQAFYLKDLDLGELRKTNSDVVCWISIPGTQLDYPVLQGEDNQYYLKRTWQGKQNSAGSIFLECKVRNDFSDFNTLIYGHNMKNGSMFGSLRQYRTQSHYEANPYIYIADDGGIRRYEIFSAFEAEVTGYTYRLDINTVEKKQALLDYSLERSVIRTGIVPVPEDAIITLSTCTGNGYDTRWVVQAVLTGYFPVWETEAPEAEH